MADARQDNENAPRMPEKPGEPGDRPAGPDGAGQTPSEPVHPPEGHAPGEDGASGGADGADGVGDPAAAQSQEEVSLAAVAAPPEGAQDQPGQAAGAADPHGEAPDYQTDEYGSEYQGPESQDYDEQYNYGSEDEAADETGDEDEDVDEDEYEDEEEDEEDEDELGQKKMTLVEHLEELRTRIIRAVIGLAVGMAISLAFGQYTFRIINDPFVKVVGKDKLVTTDMMDPFTMYMRISMYVGIVIAAPWIFYQLWMFVSAGLYPRERRYVTRSVPFSAGLFILGAVFFLKVVSLPLLRFLNYWNTEVMGLTPMVTQGNHVEFMTNMMLIFGLCFQMPVAILILAKVGLVTVKTLNRYRRHAIVAILVFAAVLSPSPSPLDQLALGIPMWLLYELGVVLTYFLVEKKRRAEEAAEAARDAR